MLDFKDLKCDSFKKQTTSMQLLYMFQDSLRILNQKYANSKSLLGTKRRVVPETCEVSADNFIIRIRVYELPDISFPVYWFTAQSAAYRSVRGDSRSRIDVEYVEDNPSFAEVVYRLWIDLPF